MTVKAANTLAGHLSNTTSGPDVYAQLEPLCLARLADAFNPSSGCYDRQLRDGGWDATHGTEDMTSTAICLVGLSRAGALPQVEGLDPMQVLEALVGLSRRHGYAGGLGLVVWANAVWEGRPVAALLDGAGTSLDRLMAALPTLTTMETAWLVSGLVHERGRAPESCTVNALDAALAELVSRYQERARIFCHAHRSAPLAMRLRRWVPNFADQIYSVQALAFAAAAGFTDRGMAAAEGCAARLVELQGELGQWWWHYDARDGSMAQAYPVYSVHQYGMAPMALAALAAAGGAAFDEGVRLSRAWVTHNELGTSMVDEEAGTIWRDIECGGAGIKNRLRHLRSIVGWPRARIEGPDRLTVNRETRPYEWAWCLYASAIEAGVQRGTHVV